MAISLVRKTATEVLKANGFLKDDKFRPVFTDKSKSGHRTKFCWVRPTDEQLVVLRKEFAEKHPNTSTRVWIVAQNPGSYGNYGGVAFKIFNS